MGDFILIATTQGIVEDRKTREGPNNDIVGRVNSKLMEPEDVTNGDVLVRTCLQERSEQDEDEGILSYTQTCTHNTRLHIYIRNVHTFT